MNAFLLQSTIAWAASLALYFYLLRKTTFFALNRWYLLFTLIFGLIATYLAEVIHPWANLESTSQVFGVFPEINIGVEPRSFSQNTFSWLEVIYFLGVGFFFFRLLFGLYSLLKLYQTGLKEKFKGYTLIRNPRITTPFSFFSWIFISESNKDIEALQPIIEHEKMHIRMGHSFDLLVLEVLNCIFWFQPLLRIYKKAIKETHEFLADDVVSKKATVEAYIQMLLAPYTAWKEPDFVSPFYQSQIKNRIHMLNHNRSNRKQLLFYLLSPVMLGTLALVFSSFTTPAKATAKEYWMMGDTLPKNQKLVPPPSPPKKPSAKDRIAPPPPPPPPPPVAPVSPADAETPEEATDAMLAPPPPPPPPPPSNQKQRSLSADQADEMPRFPGCENSGSLEQKNQCSHQKLMSWIAGEMKYPELARKNKTQGRCIAKFVVNTEGYVENIVIEYEPGDGTGNEVMRILSKMNMMPERWIPAKKNGKNVSAVMTLPVNFWLDK